jgi:hypothetical protein
VAFPIPLLQPETSATRGPSFDSNCTGSIAAIVVIAAEPAIINSYVVHEKPSVVGLGRFASNTRGVRVLAVDRGRFEDLWAMSFTMW